MIVGAGLVGTTLACYLGQQQPELRIILLDASPEPFSTPSPSPHRYGGEHFDPRVVALSPGSQKLLDDLGVWPKILAARACPYRHMQVWDAEGTASINFSSHDLYLPALGHIVENSVALNALHQRLREDEASNQLTRIFDKRLVGLRLPAPDSAHADSRVRVELDTGEHFTTRLLIAADGATSGIRDMAEFRTREWDYGHAAIVTTVRTARSHEFTAWQRFQTSGPLAFLPLQVSPSDPEAGGNCYSSIVWSIATGEAEALMQLDDAAFCAELGNAFEQRLGPIVAVDKRFCVPLQQRHAVRYWQQGVALVGDAAHSLHPLAGQGVNLGLRDAQVLGEEIGRACRRGIPLSDSSILKRYERRRQGHNMAAMVTMEAFKRLFAAEAPALRWLRNAGMSLVNEQAWLKKRLAALAIE